MEAEATSAKPDEIKPDETRQAAQAALKTPFAPWRDPAAVPYLRIRNVVKRFGAVTAVDNISLDIHAREFFALLGPSGCGKTTLLRMLAGFDTPDAGSIELDGVDIADIPPYERPVNMMFQSYALFPHMTVEKNISFGLEQERMPKPERQARVEEMLALAKLEQLAKRRPDQLSGGQRQRVALARALAKRPKLMLLDEPLGALDKKLREETQFELVNIQERLGLTFVIVTHDQEEAMTVSSRLAVMDHGQIAQVGTPQEVYEAPQTRFVADFIGDVNLLEGAIAEIGAQGVETGVEGGGLGGVVVTSPDAPAQIRASRIPDHVAAQGVGAAIEVALRPEKLLIEKHDPDAAAMENSAVGVVEDIAYLGDMSIYRVRLPSGRVMKASRTNRQRTLAQTITWEDEVRLSWDAGAVVIVAG
ncbi:MAG: ABC transporter ATP-binding protein [Rhodobacteraceae bacterium]|nr:ABC transporter ATP-binding protein [Paracoccaceae bacterium]